MKEIIKRSIHFFILRNRIAWRFTQATLIRFSNYLIHQKYQIMKMEADRDIERLAGDHLGRTVQNGPFQGMRYPDFLTVESTLLPKLLGSYEKEIHPWIDDICRKKYSHIINIGCAEGYYAVGFALRIPDANVYAYDIDRQARKLCKKMAKFNGVENRVVISDRCFSSTLTSFSFSGRGLIFCDCEGDEKQLFTPDTLANLRCCDLLIELHDYIDITISSTIHDLFKNTHHHQFIKSLDDIEKAKTYHYKELEGLDINTRKRFVSEERPSIMEWIYLTPFHKQPASAE